LAIGFIEHLQNVTTNNYEQPHWVTHSKVYCNYSTHTHIVSSVFTICCLVAAPNGGRSLSSGLPNSHPPQLPASQFSQLQLSTDWITTQKSQSYVTTDGQSASLSWNKAPIWRPDLYYCQTVAGLLVWGALSDERTGLSFARVTISSNKYVDSMYNLHFTCMYIQHIQGYRQSRLSTADHALNYQFSLYSPGKDRTENVSSIIVFLLVAGETWPQSCFLAVALVLPPVYTAVTWQWSTCHNMTEL
jgi:hypothetical protein